MKAQTNQSVDTLRPASGPSDEARRPTTSDSSSFDSSFSLASLVQNSAGDLTSSHNFGAGGVEFDSSELFGVELTEAPAQGGPSAPFKPAQSAAFSGSDLFSSFNLSQSEVGGGFDGGESDLWSWIGLNSIESPAGTPSSTADVDTPQSTLNNDDISLLLTPQSPTDSSFESYSAAQPFSRNDPFVVEPSSSNAFNSYDYTELFALKPQPTPADEQLFNGGSINTNLVFDNAPAYRDLDAQLCSPLDVSPPSNALGDFGSALLADYSTPDDSFSPLATPALDFGNLTVDPGFDANSLFGPLPGQDLIGGAPATQGMVAIKEEIEEDQLDSTPATPDLEDEWAKPTEPIHNTRKRKLPSSAVQSELDSSPAPEPEPQPTKRPRRAQSSAPPVLPLDAPIQARKYNGESKTSRKAMPKAIERSLGAAAKGRDPDELKADVDSRRAQNTLAARKSRQKKAEEVANLRSENEELKDKLARYMEKFGEL